MKTLRYVSILLLAAATFCAYGIRPAAAEESLLVLTTSDTRGELVPCG